MFGFQNLKTPTEIFKRLRDFEMFCRGEKELSPDEYRNVNKELSIGAVLNIGKSKMITEKDGQHLIWYTPDNHEHDLGPVESMNVYREYPGFHRSRSIALGKHDVLDVSWIEPQKDKQITMVKMRDGSIGYGPNYRIALRNAALKMHLKEQMRNKPVATNLFKNPFKWFHSAYA